MDEKRGIGKNNALMWKILGELKRFKEITMEHPIIMGRKTYESIGRVLPRRTNIIITRDDSYKVEGAMVVNSLEKGLKIAAEEEKNKSVIASETKQSQNNGIATVAEKSLAMTVHEPEIFVIGGGQIFEQSLPLADRLYLTLVKGDFGADVFFPEYEALFKTKISEQPMKTDEYEYFFVTLER